MCNCYSHSPRSESHLHHHYHHHQQQQQLAHGRLSPHCPSPYLEVYEPLPGAAAGGSGGRVCRHHRGDVSASRTSAEAVPVPVGSPGGPSIPIETSEDMNELQAVFISSLQIQHH